MKLIEKVKKIYFPIYGYTIHLVVTNDIITSRKKRDKLIGEIYKKQDNDKFVGGMHSYNDNDSFNSYIFVGHKLEVNSVVHECFHAIFRMFRCIGEHDAGEEIWAYTLGYLSEELTKLINKK